MRCFCAGKSVTAVSNVSISSMNVVWYRDIDKTFLSGHSSSINTNCCDIDCAFLSIRALYMPWGFFVSRADK